ncbi:MAG: lipase, partial [Candidatus Dormibacteraeota bacterium]|nr:lipase [Candidatus Dormibacteraeota bacterium]
MTIESRAESLIDLPLTGGPVTIDGALELERTAGGLLPHRLPASARAQFPDDDMLRAVESQPSGVRLAFRTAATLIELQVLPTKLQFEGAPLRPAVPFDLRVDGTLTAQASVEGGNVLQLSFGTRRGQVTPGRPGTARFAGLPARMKEVEIWLPHQETVELIALRADAPAEPAASPGRPRWLHHGSSISH